MMEDLAHCINSNQFELSRIYNSVCGRHHSEKDKTWVVDVDNACKSGIQAPMDEYEFFINSLQPEVDIHKNNPTILYIP